MAFIFVDDQMKMVVSYKKCLTFPNGNVILKLRKTKEAADMVKMIHTRGGWRGNMIVSAFFLRKRQHKASIVGA